MSYDVLMPLHPKDIFMVEYAVESLLKNAIGLRNIYIVSETDPEIKSTIWISEKEYPFTGESVQSILQSTNDREGWYLQQLLKLYCFRVIPNLHSNVLIFDSDIVLRKPTEFLDASGVAYMDIGHQNTPEYIEHAKRILGDSFRRVYDDPWISGITDHMLFKRSIIEDLLTKIEHYTGKEAWIAMIEAVNPKDKDTSGMSEFEIYFNYALSYYPSEYSIRQLIKCAANYSSDIHTLDADLVSFHSWARRFKT